MARFGLTDIECAVCGKNIPFKPMAHIRRTKNTYCSPQCSGKAKRLEDPVDKKNCEVCGIALIRNPKREIKRWNARKFCAKCTRIRKGKHTSNWKGGRAIRNGYVYLCVDGRRIHEHRLIAEKALGRPLKAGSEVVHHIDCNKQNNSNSNLLICSNGYHRWLHEEMSRRYAALIFGANNGTGTGVV